MRYAIAISVVVHVALIVWSQQQPAPRAVTHASPVVPAVAAEPAPVVVTLLDDDSVPTNTIDPRHTTPTAATGHIASHATPHAETAPPGNTPPTGDTPPNGDTPPIGATHAPVLPGTTPPHSYWLAMRTPTENLISSLTEGAIGGGGIGGEPKWGHPPTGDELDAQREADLAAIDARRNAELQPDGRGMKSDHKAFSMKVAPDGSVTIKDKPNWQQKGLFYAEFDTTDMLMRKHGMDPYSSYKLKILDETREQRYEMGKQFKTEQLAQSGRFMQKNIERLVASIQDVAALKRGLFELWDDCAESGSDEIVAGGKSAREQLLGFVRRRFPPGSADAFTTEELAQLNQHRTSHATFEPYL